MSGYGGAYSCRLSGCWPLLLLRTRREVERKVRGKHQAALSPGVGFCADSFSYSSSAYLGEVQLKAETRLPGHVELLIEVFCE